MPVTLVAGRVIEDPCCLHSASPVPPRRTPLVSARATGATREEAAGWLRLEQGQRAARRRTLAPRVVPLDWDIRDRAEACRLLEIRCILIFLLDPLV
jgi:hypothetical protein